MAQAFLLWALLLVAPLHVQSKPTFAKTPKDILCQSNRIYATVGEWTDRKGDWLSVDVKAKSVAECVRACYEYRYCYSVSYDEKQATSCSFYLHVSNKECKQRSLKAVEEIRYDGQPLFVECLRCVSEQEANSPVLGIDYLKKTDDAGTKITVNADQGYDMPEKQRDEYPELMDKVAFKTLKECDGDLLFRRSVLPVTSDQIHSMPNSTLAGSAKGCARACFSAQSCHNAIYIPGSGLCVFDAKESVLPATCSQAGDEVTELKATEPTRLECVRCNKRVKYETQGKASDAPLSPNVLVGGNGIYARSCTVTFQVFNQLDGLNFETSQEASVASLNECAFICYQNSCSGAIYEPPSGQNGEAKCRVAIRQKENCSAQLQNHYSFNTHKSVALSCFRCVANRPTTLSPDAEIITSTISSVAAPGEPAGKGNVDEHQTDEQSSIQLVHTKQGCAIMFQADKMEQRPSEFTSTFDTELAVETADVCATRCYQNGCTGALFVAEQRLCKLGYGDRHSCSQGSLVSHFVPQNSADKIWIHCVSCQQDTSSGKLVSMERGSTAAPTEEKTTGLPIGRDETQTTAQVTEAPGQDTTVNGYETTGFQGTTQSASEQPETTIEGETTSASGVTPSGDSLVQQTNLAVETTPESVGTTQEVLVTTGEPEDLASKKVISGIEASHDQSTTAIPVEPTNAVEPVQITGQPETSTQGVAGESQQPEASTQGVAGESQQSESSTQGVTGESQQPETSTLHVEIPTTIAVEPVQVTGQPEVTTQGVAGESQQPEVTTQGSEIPTTIAVEPVQVTGESQQPETSTLHVEIPTTIAVEPVQVTGQPEVTTQGVEIPTTQSVAEGSQQPETSTLHVEIPTTQGVAEGSQQPEASTQGSEIPTTIAVEPVQVTGQPEVTTQEPHPSTVSVDFLASEGTLPTTAQPEETTKSPEEEKLSQAVTEINKAVSELKEAVTELQKAEHPHSTTPSGQESSESPSLPPEVTTESGIVAETTPLEEGVTRENAVPVGANRDEQATTIVPLDTSETSTAESELVSKTASDHIAETTSAPSELEQSTIAVEAPTTGENVAAQPVEGSTVVPEPGQTTQEPVQQSTIAVEVPTTGESVAAQPVEGSTVAPEPGQTTIAVEVPTTGESVAAVQPIEGSTSAPEPGQTTQEPAQQTTVESVGSTAESLITGQTVAVQPVEGSTAIPEPGQSTIASEIPTTLESVAAQPVEGSTSAPEPAQSTAIPESPQTVVVQPIEGSTSVPEPGQTTQEPVQKTTIEGGVTGGEVTSQSESPQTVVVQPVEGSTAVPEPGQTTQEPVQQTTIEGEILTTGESVAAVHPLEGSTSVPEPGQTTQEPGQTTAIPESPQTVVVQPIEGSTSVPEPGQTTQEPVQQTTIEGEKSTVEVVQEGLVKASTSAPEPGQSTIAVEVPTTLESVVTGEGSTSIPEVPQTTAESVITGQTVAEQPEPGQTTQEPVQQTTIPVEVPTTGESVAAVQPIEGSTVVSEPGQTTQEPVQQTTIESGVTGGEVTSQSESPQTVVVQPIEGSTSVPEPGQTTQEPAQSTAIPESPQTVVVQPAERSTSAPEPGQTTQEPAQSTAISESPQTVVVQPVEGSTPVPEPGQTTLESVLSGNIAKASTSEPELVQTTIESIVTNQQSTEQQKAETGETVIPEATTLGITSEPIVQQTNLASGTTPESVGTTQEVLIMTGEPEDLASKKVISGIEASHDQSTTAIPVEIPTTVEVQESIQTTLQPELVQTTQEIVAQPIEQGTTSEAQPVETSTSKSELPETSAAPENTATVPTDNLIPIELTTQANEPSSLSGQEGTTIESDDGVTSPLPPAQTSIIVGEPAVGTTQSSASTDKESIPEAETAEPTVQPEQLTTIGEEPTGTTEELESAKTSVILGQPVATTLAPEGVTNLPLETTQQPAEQSSTVQIINVDGEQESTTPSEAQSTLAGETIAPPLAADQQEGKKLTVETTTEEPHPSTVSVDFLASEGTLPTTAQPEETTKSPEEEKLSQAVTEINKAVSELKEAVTELQKAEHPHSTTPSGQESSESPSLPPEVTTESGIVVETTPLEEGVTRENVVPIGANRDEQATTIVPLDTSESSTSESELVSKTASDHIAETTSAPSELEQTTIAVEVPTTGESVAEQPVEGSTVAPEPGQTTQEPVQQTTLESVGSTTESLVTGQTVAVQPVEGSTAIPEPGQSTIAAEIPTTLESVAAQPVEGSTVASESDQSTAIPESPQTVVVQPIEGSTSVPEPGQTTQEPVQQTTLESGVTGGEVTSQSESPQTVVVQPLEGSTAVPESDQTTQEPIQQTTIEGEILTTGESVAAVQPIEGSTSVPESGQTTQEPAQSTAIPESPQTVVVQPIEGSTSTPGQTTQEPVQQTTIEGERSTVEVVQEGLVKASTSVPEPGQSTIAVEVPTTLESVVTGEGSTSIPEVPQTTAESIITGQTVAVQSGPGQTTQEPVQQTTISLEVPTTGESIAAVQPIEGSTSVPEPGQTTKEPVQQTTIESGVTNEGSTSIPESPQTVVVQPVEGSTSAPEAGQTTQEPAQSTAIPESPQTVVVQPVEGSTSAPEPGQTTQEPAQSTAIPESPQTVVVQPIEESTSVPDIGQTTLESVLSGNIAKASTSEPELIQTTIESIVTNQQSTEQQKAETGETVIPEATTPGVTSEPIVQQTNLAVETTPESVGTTQEVLVTTGEPEDLASKKVISGVEASHDQSTTAIPVEIPTTSEVQEPIQTTLQPELVQTTIEQVVESSTSLPAEQSTVQPPQTTQESETQSPNVSGATEIVPLLQGEDRKLATGEQQETTTPQSIEGSSTQSQLVTNEVQETTVGGIIETSTQPKEQIGSGFVTESQINEPASTGASIEQGSTPASVIEQTAVTEPGGEIVASKTEAVETTEHLEITTSSIGLEIAKNKTVNDELFPPEAIGEASAESTSTTLAFQSTGGEVTEAPEVEGSGSTSASVIDGGATTENVKEAGSQPTTIVESSTLVPEPGTMPQSIPEAATVVGQSTEFAESTTILPVILPKEGSTSENEQPTTILPVQEPQSTNEGSNKPEVTTVSSVETTLAEQGSTNLEQLVTQVPLNVQAGSQSTNETAESTSALPIETTSGEQSTTAIPVQLPEGGSTLSEQLTTAISVQHEGLTSENEQPTTILPVQQESGSTSENEQPTTILPVQQEGSTSENEQPTTAIPVLLPNEGSTSENEQPTTILPVQQESGSTSNIEQPTTAIPVLLPEGSTSENEQPTTVLPEEGSTSNIEQLTTVIPVQQEGLTSGNEQPTTILPVETTLAEILEGLTNGEQRVTQVPLNVEAGNQTVELTTVLPIETTLSEHPVTQESEVQSTQEQTTVQPIVIFSKSTQSPEVESTPLSELSTGASAETSTAVPEIVRAVSELVDAIGRNKNDTLATTPEPPVQAVSELVQTLSKHGDILRENQGGFGSNGCNGDLYFSAKELTDFSQPFQMILASDTVRDCARSCFDLGCTSAAFTRFPRPACLLHFKEHELLLTQKCFADNRLNTTWKFTREEEVVELLCIKCGEKIRNDDANAADLESTTLRENKDETPIQGFSDKCNGRVEFQIAAVATFPKLNVTNDVQADSPAHCAQKCLETEGCTTAGFVPITSSNSGSGVCLLTSDTTSCLDDIGYHPQHASTVPFVISCIKCTKCKYTLSVASPDTQLVHKYDSVENVGSVTSCAEKCAAINCVKAEFDPTNLTCSLTSNQELKPKQCPNEKALETNSIIPVILDCVQCAS